MPDIYERLLEGLARQRKWWELSPLLNWQDVLDAREAYAAALGRSVEELTKAEKQIAWLNQVMEKLGEQDEKETMG